MKSRIVITFILCIICWFTYSQGVSINNSGALADSSAILDVSSTSKGILIPRMTTTERNAINNPATGLIIYNNDSDCFNTYDGASWNDICGGTGGSGSDCLPRPTVPSDYEIVCLNGNLNLYASTTETGVTYTWNGPSYHYSSSDSTMSLSNMQPENLGLYLVTISKLGCTSDAAFVNVMFPATQHGSQGFAYTGGIQYFEVPPCVASITLKVWGAGGGGSGKVGGTGGYSTGTLAVTPGDSIKILVGQGGVANCQNACSVYGGGGKAFYDYAAGGGYSGVFTLGNSPIIIAGGGGGGSQSDCGGGSNGSGGGSSGNNGSGWISGDNEYGRGGTQGGGGAGGSCYPGYGPAGAGSYLQGGTGGIDNTRYGGGGGGGYYGGGGGCWGGTRHGGGGGGSGYIGGAGLSGTSTTTGCNTGDPDYQSGTCGGGSTWNNGQNGYVNITW